MTSPPARAAARLVRSIDSLTFALFALMGPPSLIVAGLVLSAPRTPRWSEIVALVLVHALTTLNVVLPVAVVLFNGFFTQRPTNQLVQLCAVHFVWNAHVMGHTVMCLPFLVHKYASHGITHAEVVYDVATFWMFVAWPLQLSTGVLKAVVARKQQRFDWKHRALLGVALINITLFYAVGTYYVRPKTFRVHVACTMAFYGYGISSMLPASPQGDGPEITGAREWPALKLWLRPFLWEPIREYMQMRIILDAGSAPDAVSAARSASQVDLLKLAAAATKSHADAKSRAVAARLDAAEAHVVAALAELGALADATPEVHRIADALRESVRLLERRSEATRRGADGALRDGEAALFGFHVIASADCRNTGTVTEA
ncbi:hypothetical protein M885DRAFT_172731 [Pelagophyceae sp. CCMP2097]|nr:hypothetical protein M885DRAFT_172731 [Pelagophyceae sp. CCMP2097]